MRIYRVRIEYAGTGGVASEWPFKPGELIHIDDRAIAVLLEVSAACKESIERAVCQETKLSKNQKSMAKSPGTYNAKKGHWEFWHNDVSVQHLTDMPAGNGFWYKFDVAQLLNRRRSVGLCKLFCTDDPVCAVELYVVPRAVFSVDDVGRMVDLATRILDRTVAWACSFENRNNWAQGVFLAKHFGCEPHMSTWLPALRSELEAAQALRRRPYVDLATGLRANASIPENAVVSRWASMRAALLVRLLGSSYPRMKGMVADSAGSARAETVRMLGTVIQMVRNAELSVPMPIGPSVMRDHRVRTLMRAFEPPPVHLPAELPAGKLVEPFAVLNDLFELYCFSWLVAVLMDMGFHPTILRSLPGVVADKHWYAALTRREVSIELQLEVLVTLPQAATSPGLSPLDYAEIEEAGVEHVRDKDHPFVSAIDKYTPDFALRLTGPNGRRLLVGDAVLDDPTRYDPNKANFRKDRTVAHYVATIAWASPEGLVRCDPLGGFVLAPGPQSAWNRFEGRDGGNLRDKMKTAPRITVIAPHPSKEPEMAAAQFVRFVEYHVNKVDRVDSHGADVMSGDN